MHGVSLGRTRARYRGLCCSKWSKIGAANGSTSELSEDSIQACKRQLLWRCDLYANGLAIGCEINDQAPVDLAGSNALLPSAPRKIEVCRERATFAVGNL